MKFLLLSTSFLYFVAKVQGQEVTTLSNGGIPTAPPPPTFHATLAPPVMPHIAADTPGHNQMIESDLERQAKGVDVACPAHC